MMDDRPLSAIFDECLERLAAGETVEQCLRRYPRHAEALRPLLQTVRLAQAARPDSGEVAAAQQRARRRVDAALAEPPPRRRSALLRGMRSLSVAAALVLIFAGAALATGSSLPGDPLYGLKRQAERVGLALTGDSEAARAQLAQTRRDEVRRLLEAGRESEVTFSGTLQTMEGRNWQVDDLLLRLDADSQVSAAIRVGAVVSVRARTTADRRLVATSVQLLESAGPERPLVPTVLPASPTLAPTQTPVPLTSTPNASHTPRPTETLEPPTATDGPVQSAVEGCTPVHPPGWVVWQIRAGDTLSGLAHATGATVEAIIAANCLSADGLIVAGRYLYLPSTSPTRAPGIQPQLPDMPSPGSDDGDQRGEGRRGSDSSDDDDPSDSDS